MHGAHFILLWSGTTFTWSQEGNFPDSLPHFTTLHPSQRGGLQIAVLPQTFVYFPDSVSRPFVTASEQPSFAFDPYPIVPAPTLYSTVYPDAVQHFTTLHPSQRGGLQIGLTPPPFVYYPDFILPAANLGAHRQLAVTELSPYPERTSTLAATVFPDRVDRPYLQTAEQLAVTEIPPLGFAGLFGAVFPDRIGFVWTHPVEQLAFATSQYPEGTIPLDWEPEYPDSALRQFVAAAEQPYFGFYPLPITSVVTPNITPPSYPDVIFRATLSVAEQQAFALAPEPEEKIQLDWDPVYPDRALHSWLPVSEHLAFATSPQPEEPTDLVWEPVYPDRALHPCLTSADQPFFASNIAPERTQSLAVEVHPDRIDHPYLLTANQLAVTELSPKPEEKVQLDWDPVYPDRASHSWLPVSEHLAFATSQQPEEPTDLVWEPVYPDRAVRPFAPTNEQPYFTFAPYPERTQSIAITVFPDRIDRPCLPAAEQLAVTELYPYPQETIQLDWDPCYPDRAIRLWLSTADQPYFAFAPYPERTSTLASEVHPDRIDKPFLGAQQQLAVTELAPYPERTSPITVVVFQDRVDRPFLGAPEQLAVSEISPKPERTSALATTVFPDQVLRLYLLTANQLAVTELPSRPEEEVQLDWDPIYPDRALHVWLTTADQPYFTFAPYPERTQSIAVVVFSDRIDRPYLLAAQQLAVTELPPYPEEPTDLVWEPVYPDRALHAWLTTADQPFFASNISPERTSSLAVTVFPDRVDRPYLLASQQLASTELSPKPEEKVQLDWAPIYPDRAPHVWLPVAEHLAFATSPQPQETIPLDWDPCYPDRALRFFVPTSEQPYFAFAPYPERTSTLAVEVHPDRIDRPYLLTANQLAVTEIPTRPEEEVQLDWDPIYPDRALHLWLSTADQLYFSFAPYPERTSTLASEVHPDRVDRPYILTANQLAVTELSPQPERTSTLASEVHPDRVDRPFLGAPEQLAVTELSPEPERTSTLASEVHPDRVDRPYLLTANQQAVTEIPTRPEEPTDLVWDPIYPDCALHPSVPTSEQPYFAFAPYPERTSPLATEVHPDRIDRPFLGAYEQLAVTELAPYPEGDVALDWDPIYPDRVLRPWLTTADQPFFASNVQPERTSPIAAEVHPDRVDRPFLGPVEQLAVTEISPQPERTTPIAVVVFPDRVDRPYLLTAIQLAVTENYPLPQEAEPLDWNPVYPDRAIRPWLSTADQPVFAFAPAPERTSSLAVEVHPDRIDRPYLQAAQQLAVTEIIPKPEEEVQLDWDPIYPDRAPHLWVPTSEQPYFTFAPQPERTSTLAVEVHPDRVDRPFLGAQEQLAVTELPPYPERTSSLAVTIFPDRVDRPFFGPAEQLAVTEIIPKPEEEVQLDWDPIYPDRALHVWLTVAEHLAFATSQYPEGEIALDWDPVYPDRIVRPFVPTSEQPYFAFAPEPERTSTLAVEVHPDRVDRPYLLTAQQLAVTEIFPKPEGEIALDWDPVYPDRALHLSVPASEQSYFAFAPEPERTSPIAVEVHPDQVLRPYLAAPEQLAVTELSPEPERTTTLAVVVFPDRVDRPYLSVAEQQAVTEIPTRPEEEVQLDWDPVYPDRALHPPVPAYEQPYFTFAPYPERTSPLASEVHADRVDRPFLAAHEQQAVTELSPEPENTIALDWDPVYPDRALHLSLGASEQPYFAFYPYPIPAAPAVVGVLFPDSIQHVSLHASEQLAFAFGPEPEEEVQLDWDPIYPDRALHLSVPTYEQPYFTFAPEPERTSPLASEVHPDRVDRPYLLTANQQAVTEIPAAPEGEIALDWDPIYPDRVLKPAVPSSEQPYFTFAPYPERTSTLAVEVHPDRVDRPFFGPQEQLAVTELSPEPERTSPLASEVHPDRVDRPYLLTANQQAVTEIPVEPEGEIALDWDPIFPDRAIHLWLTTADQPYFAFAPYPERTSSLAAVVFPDRVDRPYLLTANQLAVTEVAPHPEEPTDLVWDPIYPDRALHLWLTTADQSFFALAPQPERTSTIAVEIHPDQVLRPFLGPVEQLAVSEIPPYPERTQSIAVVVFPDRVDRPYLLTANQLAVTEVAPRPEGEVALDWDPIYPDRALHLWLTTADQPFFAFAPAPERTSPLAVEVHPDRVDRPYLLAASHQAVSEIIPYPEGEIALDWDPVYPDRATHLWLATADQPYFAFAPEPERTAPLAVTVFPDRAQRPFLGVESQEAVTEVAPQPEEPTDIVWDPIYPDRVLHFWLTPADQQFYASAITPERTSPLATVVFPDRVDRPFFRVVDQLAVTGLSPEPERTSPLAVTVFPDRVDRPYLLTANQLAPADFAPQPEEEVQLDWDPIYPERVARPYLLTANQLAVTELPAQPEEEIALDWDPIYPDRALHLWFLTGSQQAYAANTAPITYPVGTGEQQFTSFPDIVLRPYLTTGEQLAVTEIPSRPERTSSIAVTVFPDRVDRPYLLAANQQAVTEIPTRPEEKVQLDWDPIYPDRALHLWLAAAEQLAVTEIPSEPERTQALAAVVHPDRVDRPFLTAAEQLAVTEIPAEPEGEIALDWDPVYPDRATHLWLAVAEHQAFTAATVPITFVVGRQQFTSYPDRVDRPFLPAAEQLAVTEIFPEPERTSPLASVVYPDQVLRLYLRAELQLAAGDFAPRPEEEVQLDWDPIYPDRALHLWLSTTEQPYFTFAPDPERTSTLASEVHPDRVVRPYLGPEDQQAVTEIAPEPEEKVRLDWDPNYPDRVLHAWLPTADQPYYASAPVAPERTSAIAVVVFPDRVDRPFLGAPEQLPVTEISPAPERTTPLAAEVHPDRVDRPTLHVSQHLAVTEIPTEPEEEVQLDWDPNYPDRTLKPILHVSQHLAVTEIFPKPEEEVQLDWDPIYPDRALHVWLSTSDQPYFAFDPFPFESPAFTSISITFPDRVLRATLPIAQHLAVTEISPYPERTASLASEVHPDRVDRPYLGPELQQSVTEVPTLAGVVYTIYPVSIPSGEVFGIPTQEFIVFYRVIQPSGISSSETFGTPTQEFIVERFHNVITFIGIASGETFGSMIVTYTPFVLRPSGIPSGEAFGIPTQSRVLTR